MPIPKKIDPAKQYSITVGRPVRLPDDAGMLLPSHDEIRVSGAVLLQIKDEVLSADECPAD